MSTTTVALILPAAPESLTVVRQALSGVGESQGWSEPFLADAKLAVSEACSNVVVHAYPDGDDGTLEVRITLTGDHVQVVVRDEGVGITPRSSDRTAGLGLGLPLIAALASDVQLRTATDGATEIAMGFTRAHGEQQ